MSEKGQGDSGLSLSTPDSAIDDSQVHVGPGMALDELGNEITIRSDFDLDANSQAADANPTGSMPAPSGSSAVGDPFDGWQDVPGRDDPST
jgi:hypothetical protein